ncbi:ectonucleotide pyrophosphatase/phosphodiesterase family member 5-like protein, partial [Leptotrombidium deliense]
MRTEQKWYGGEPIWITAKKQGKRANVFHWPGSNVNFTGMTPDFYFPQYSHEPPLEKRLEKIIEWVDEGVDLSMMYFYQPDNIAHKNGVFSVVLGKEVERIDTVLGKFIDELSKPERNHVDLIIVADHGMVNYTEVVVLSDYINFEEEVERMPQYGAIASILPKPGKLEIVYEKLKNAHPNITVYLKDEIPERLRYKHPTRTMPIIIIGNEGVQIVEKREYFNKRKIAHHGYDNTLPSMHPIFFAMGPSFRKKSEIQPFDA